MMNSGKGMEIPYCVTGAHHMDDLVREGLLTLATGNENENDVEMQERETERTRPRSRVNTANIPCFEL